MKFCPKFALVLFLLAPAALAQQGVSPAETAASFDIVKGASFSTSPRATGQEAVPASSTAGTTAAAKITSDYKEALEIIRKNYAGRSGSDVESLTKASIAALLAELDPHSSYFDRAEFSELLSDQEGEYSGTGSTISSFVKNGVLDTFVLSVHLGSPAERAELRYGDRIVAVDGASVVGMDSVTVRDKVRGLRGTTVRIAVERAESGRIETLEIRRDRVSQPSIPNFFLVRDAIGYIGLSEGFSHTTSAELEVALAELHRRGMKSLILDLRGNSGGILEQAVKVTEKFLSGGSSIISERGKRGSYVRMFRSTNSAPESLPVVVLVDKQTASASEVVAGALQDNDRALIIGQTTFGKGLVQEVVALPNGSGMTLTTARYFTPSGRSIQRRYSGTGRYEYFTRPERAPASGPETRTITNRSVFGERGIEPDEVTSGDAYDPRKAALIDPMFFFVREVINRHAKHTGDPLSSRDSVRQSIIFGQPIPPDLVNEFRSFAARPEWNIGTEVVDSDPDFVAAQLQFYFALATFGPEAAARQRIQSDKEVAQAIEALPRSAILANAARHAKEAATHKKTRGVAFPAGQGRNRRN